LNLPPSNPIVLAVVVVVALSTDEDSQVRLSVRDLVDVVSELLPRLNVYE
jgi:hypothetical protein